MKNLLIALILFSFSARASDPATLKCSRQVEIGNDQLNEISGAVYINGQLWVINDGPGDNTLYRIDDKGNIVQKIVVTNAINADWEELTYSKGKIYIGDFGNNNSKRKFFRIYIIDATAINEQTTEVLATMNGFRYNGHDDVAPDCEAMVCSGRLIHLFTKSSSGQYEHFILPDESGFHVAASVEKRSAAFQVTAACTWGKKLILTGYDISSMTIFIEELVLDDDGIVKESKQYKAGNLFQLGQVESICISGNEFVLLSESVKTGILNKPSCISYFQQLTER